MFWQLQRTKSFNKWWKKENIEDKNYEYHERALVEFQNVVLPYAMQTRIFSNPSFECWVTRLPDKVRKRGHLKYDGSSGKYDDRYEVLIKALAQEFVVAK